MELHWDSFWEALGNFGATLGDTGTTFFFGAIEMSSANKKVGPGGAQSHPKAPQGLPKAVPMEPHVLPGARFAGFGEPLLFFDNAIVV